MRKRLFEIIELSDGNDRLSRIYDLFMMCVIVISLIPLAFKETNYLFVLVDYITASIFATFTIIASGFKILKLFRLLRTFRVFKVFKIVRYSKSITVISNVIKKQKEPLIAVCVLAAAYIVICALIIFNVEPDTFDNFFSAIYWATVSLTTMGYGDIYPVSTIGRVVTMLSSFVGIAIVALPAGIITAGYMDEIKKE